MAKYQLIGIDADGTEVEGLTYSSLTAADHDGDLFVNYESWEDYKVINLETGEVVS